MRLNRLISLTLIGGASGLSLPLYVALKADQGIVMVVVFEAAPSAPG